MKRYTIGDTANTIAGQPASLVTLDAKQTFDHQRNVSAVLFESRVLFKCMCLIGVAFVNTGKLAPST